MHVKFTGTVTPFSGQGRKIGYPTANIDVEQTAPEGVFIGTTTIGSEIHPSVIFIGTPHMFGETKKRAETHILDFEDRDLYGTKIEVLLIEKIRDNQNFDTVEELLQVMAHDKQTAAEYFINDQREST